MIIITSFSFIDKKKKKREEEKTHRELSMEESLVKAHHPTIDPKDPSDVMNEKDQHHDDNNLKKSVTIATTSIEKQTTADVSIHDSKELSSKPCRVVLSVDDLNSMDRSILIDNWNRQQEYVQVLEHRLQQTLDSKEQVVELEQKLKQQLFDSTRRENILIMKLTKKEQEMQDCIVSIANRSINQSNPCRLFS